MGTTPAPDQAIAARRRWLGLLARAPVDRLAAAWDALEPAPDLAVVRPPETGLVMVQGRANGDGRPFNLGEMTVTRATVRHDGAPPVLGHGYVQGRDPRHALLAASLDAVLQGAGPRSPILVDLLDALEAAEQSRDAEQRARADETRVAFFTLVRGDDG